MRRLPSDILHWNLARPKLALSICADPTPNMALLLPFQTIFLRDTATVLPTRTTRNWHIWQFRGTLTNANSKYGNAQRAERMHGARW